MLFNILFLDLLLLLFLLLLHQVLLLLEQPIYLVVLERLGEPLADLVEALDEPELVGDAFFAAAARAALKWLIRIVLKKRPEPHCGKSPASFASGPDRCDPHRAALSSAMRRRAARASIASWRI